MLLKALNLFMNRVEKIVGIGENTSYQYNVFSLFHTMFSKGFYSPTNEVGGCYTGVTLSVRPSVMKSCPGHNLKSI